MNETPSRQTIAKALMDSALVDDQNEIVYTGEFHPVAALRIECYKLRAAARAFDNFKYDHLRFEIDADPEKPGFASLRIGVIHG